MPWNDNAGGGGGGPWGSGSGGGGRRPNNNNPWGSGPGGNGRGPGGDAPDLDDLVRRFQERLGGLFGGKGGKGGGGGFGLGVIFAAAAFLWVLITGWYVVEPNQAGVVLRFGEYSRTTTPGFRLKLPYPIETVERPEVTDTQTLQVGPNQRGLLMLTSDENIVSIGFTVQWRVDTSYPDGVRDFLFNVRFVEQTLGAVSESAMREVVGTTALLPIITDGRVEVSQRARELIQATMDEYRAGVQVLNVNLQTAQPPDPVVEAFRDVDAAAQDAERVRLEATAYANQVVPNARGDAARLTQQAQAYRDSVIAEAEGQADRFNAIYTEYAQAPEVTRQRMFLETMERVLGRSELIILDGDGGAVPYLPLDRLGAQRSAAPAADPNTAGG
ncbi:MAG: FtsH protease activity modulator HflK [Pseudomonadota bacterium]